MGSLEREPSAHLLENEIEGELDKEIEGEGEYEYDEEDREKGEDEEEEDSEEVDGEGEEKAVALGSSGDDYRPFILHSISSVNDFLSKMSDRVFNNLCPRYQIPDDVPTRMAGKKENCYSGQTADVGFYEVVFMASLRLPFTKLHRRLANYLGVSVCHIYPNAWRIFLKAEILWGQMSGGLHRLTLCEFFVCYKPQQIVGSKGFYDFIIRKVALKLVTDIPDSNRDWKSRYFLFKAQIRCVDPTNGIV